MSRRSFEVRTEVPVAPAAAVDFLVDLSAHRGLHPFLVDAHVEEEGTDEGLPSRRWRVLERPRLGPLRYPIRFTATLTRLSPSSFRSRVEAAPGCTIDALTTATPVPGGAMLHEQALVVAPLPLVGYMARQARVAHERTFRHLPDVLAAG